MVCSSTNCIFPQCLDCQNILYNSSVYSTNTVLYMHVAFAYTVISLLSTSRMHQCCTKPDLQCVFTCFNFFNKPKWVTSVIVSYFMSLNVALEWFSLIFHFLLQLFLLMKQSTMNLFEISFIYRANTCGLFVQYICSPCFIICAHLRACPIEPSEICNVEFTGYITFNIKREVPPLIDS